MKQEDQRIKLTKLMIKQAMADLLKTTPNDKITISLLCEKAQINRGTFYSRYKDVNDLRTKDKTEFSDELKKFIVPFVLKTRKETVTTYDFFYQILGFFKQNANSAYIVVCTRDEDNFVDDVISAVRDIVDVAYPNIFKEKDALDIELYYEYVSGGTVSVLANRIKGGCLIPVEILAEKLNNIIVETSNYLM